MSELSLDAIRLRIREALALSATSWADSDGVAALVAELIRPEITELLKLREGLPGENCMYRPKGPALVYVHSTGAVSTVDELDWNDQTLGGRERALLRALLEYVLEQMEDG
jgi:hypothetical protein